MDNIVYLKGRTDLFSIVVKTADETLNTSTTLQDDNDLLFAVAANKSYQFALTLYVYGAANGATMDFKCGWTVPASATMAWAPVATTVATDPTFMGNAAASGHTALLTEASTPAFGLSTTATAHGIRLHGRVRTAGTAGNVQFQWAQNTSNGSNLVVEEDSNILIWTLQ